jgi:CRISPR type III-A-associated protein Csm2
MPNEFTEIFQDIRRGYSGNIVEAICRELEGEEGFSQLDQGTQEKLPAFAAWIAEEMKISPTQLRRFYTYVKSIERNAKIGGEKKLDSKTRAKLMFLLPKLAGSVTKKEQEGIKVLHKIFSTCIQKNNKIQTKDDLESFVEFFEAILDYHATFERGGLSDVRTN